MRKKHSVDLHTHSTASDGDLTPGEVVSLAKKNGIDILALTDHDTIDGLCEAEEKSRELDIEFIPGMEISAKSDEELHIIGYYVEKDIPAFLEAIGLLVKYRNDREKITIDYLNSKGIDITAEEVKQATRGNIIGRPHMAAVMIDKGYVATKREAFERYIGSEEYMKIERPKVTVEEGIDIIKKGRGVPVLAHPHSLNQSYRELDSTLLALKNIGLKGMECYYNNYDKYDIVNYLTLAKKHGLVPVGGSDYHGPNSKPGVMIGSGKDNMLDYNDQNIARILKNLKV